MQSIFISVQWRSQDLEVGARALEDGNAPMGSRGRATVESLVGVAKMRSCL